jgi:hypothetical protein
MLVRAGVIIKASYAASSVVVKQITLITGSFMIPLVSNSIRLGVDQTPFNVKESGMFFHVGVPATSPSLEKFRKTS